MNFVACASFASAVKRSNAPLPVEPFQLARLRSFWISSASPKAASSTEKPLRTPTDAVSSRGHP